MSVNIEWVGLACFRVWNNGGPVIVMDPFNPAELKKFGLFAGDASTLEQPDEKRCIEGDTVLVSSLTDIAHGFPRLVRGDPRVINTLDVVQRGSQAEVNGSPVIAVKASESRDRPEEFGAPKDNAVYAVKVGGLWIMHMGDLGHELTADELAPFVDRCDVLLAIVSGPPFTISLEDLDFLIDHLQPKWIVPMHYWLPPLEVPTFSPLSKFLERHPRNPVLHARCSTVELPLETGLDRPLIVSLKPSSYEATDAE